MNYRQLLPGPALRNYVRYFGILESDDTVNANQLFKIIADGYPGLIFQEKSDAFLNHRQEHLPTLFLHGVATMHSQKTTRDEFRNIGVYFYEEGLNSVFGIDAHELTDTHISLDLICKTALAERLLSAPSVEERIDIITFFLQAQIEKNANKRRSIGTLLREIRCGQSQSLADLQTKFQLSERMLERLFLTQVGIQPKLFTRICRFQSALGMIRNKTFRRLTDVAAEGWYSDQSHFIREFREFAGATPREFLCLAHEQAENFPEWIV